MKNKFTVNRSPLTMRYPFTVTREAQLLMVKGKCTVKGKRLMVNGTGGAV